MAEEIIIEKKSPEIAKILFAILISAVIFGLLGYYFGRINSATNTVATPVAETAVIEEASPESAIEPPESTTGWKTYSMDKAGLKFSYPNTWDVVESIGLPEGTGISPINLRFTQAGDRDGIKEYNDIFINMTVRFEAPLFAFNDLYESRIKAMSEGGIKKESYKIDGVDGSRYSDLGGIANNPYVYIVRSDDKFFFELENQNSQGMLAKEVSRETTEQILKSVKFSN